MAASQLLTLSPLRMPWRSSRRHSKDVDVTAIMTAECNESDESVDFPSNNNNNKRSASSLTAPRPANNTKQTKTLPTQTQVCPMLELEVSERETTTTSKRKVHFALEDSDQVTTVVHEFESYQEEDKELLWYSQDDFAQFSAMNLSIYSQHRYQESEQQVQLQLAYSQCSKQALRRSSLDGNRGRARRNMGHRRLRSLEFENGTAIMESACAISACQSLVEAETMPQQPKCLVNLEPLLSTLQDDNDDDDNDLRGLESHVIHGYGNKRRQHIQGVLNAQTTIHHPAMRQRILAKTASHLSRTSVMFAQVLGQVDASQYQSQSLLEHPAVDAQEETMVPAPLQ